MSALVLMFNCVIKEKYIIKAFICLILFILNNVANE